MFFLAAISFIIGGSYLFFKYKYPYLSSDIKWFSNAIAYAKYMTKTKKENILPIDIFHETVKKLSSKTMLIYKEQKFSFKEVDEMANRIASVVLRLGIRQGDTVAILMYNEPAFVWAWLGFQEIGVEAAFINYNQRKKVLLHSIKSCEAKAVFLNGGSTLYHAIEEILPELPHVTFYSFETKSGGSTHSAFKSLAEDIEQAPSDEIPKGMRDGVTFESTNSYVFTSGTTGLPKPGIVSNLRCSLAMKLFGYLDISSEDILYECLPLYHSAGSLIGVGSTFLCGNTLVLAEKFSSSNFMSDCIKHKVTLIHYVGELCRYLLTSPKSESDAQHCIRGALGNGLRQDIWKEFQTRFNIEKIVEFYGATELPFGFANVDNVVGAVGRLTPFMKMLAPVALVKFNADTGEPYRDTNGRCVRSSDDEPGLLLVKRDEKSTPFHGYKNREATKRKLVLDVFKPGDVYINSGDLFYLDSDKYMYFYDRLGDTFRWKGENVSTTEVSNILSDLPFVSDACVYGVTVPGCEGRAGMAAIALVADIKLNEDMLDEITNLCNKGLPRYAVPRFLRFKQSLDITSTFKQMKGDLKREGYDLSATEDPIYYYDLKLQNFCKLTRDVVKKIESQDLPL